MASRRSSSPRAKQRHEQSVADKHSPRCSADNSLFVFPTTRVATLPANVGCGSCTRGHMCKAARAHPCAMPAQLSLSGCANTRSRKFHALSGIVHGAAQGCYGRWASLLRSTVFSGTGAVSHRLGLFSHGTSYSFPRRRAQSFVLITCM